MSTASTSSTVTVPENQIRFPDFLVVLTIVKQANWLKCSECVHSIWEIKPPGYTYVGGWDDAKQKVVATAVFFNKVTLQQILEQARCTFAEYEHQDIVHHFLAVGYWVKKTTMRRENMPGKDFDWKEADMEEILGYVIEAPDGFFPLLNKNKTDYSVEFKVYWDQATEHAMAASTLAKPE